MNDDELNQDDQQRLEQISNEVTNMTLMLRELKKSLQYTFELLKQYDQRQHDFEDNT